MGLSNYLPSSRLAQPGVIANSGERPASPYEGQVIFQKDTNQTLVWDGSAWVMVHDTDAPPGLQLLQTASVGTSSSKTINPFTTDFDAYRIVITSLKTSGNTGVFLRLNDTTDPANASATGYSQGALYVAFTNNTPVGYGANGASAGFYVSDAGTNNGGCVIDLMGPKLAQHTTIVFNGLLIGYSWSGTGVHTVATAYSGFTLRCDATGTSFTDGTIRVYGYRN